MPFLPGLDKPGYSTEQLSRLLGTGVLIVGHGERVADGQAFMLTGRLEKVDDTTVTLAGALGVVAGNMGYHATYTAPVARIAGVWTM